MRSCSVSSRVLQIGALWLCSGVWLCTRMAGAQLSSPTVSSSVEVAAQLDINTATAAELRALPGMGAAYAKRVIDGRPYSAKNQLVTRGVLPQTTYEQIRDLIVAHRVSGRTAQ